mmetsp:Transcript_60123/g.127370  ORF Transcript_60123/g.127370 Transcript_60123/m.127370 type:complete len:136 (+) Transcript_60123:38-445(+)
MPYQLCDRTEDCPAGFCCWNHYECLDPEGVLSLGDTWPSRCACSSNDFCRRSSNGTEIDGLCCDQYQETCQPDDLAVEQPGDICMGSKDPDNGSLLPWFAGVFSCVAVLAAVACCIHCKRRRRRQRQLERAILGV